MACPRRARRPPARLVAVLCGDVTVAHHAEDWLRRSQPRLKRRSSATYRFVLEHYVTPAFGDVKVREMTRPLVLRWLADLGGAGLGTGTVQLALRVLSAMLNEAVELEILPTNPAARLGRRYRAKSTARAYNEEQLSLFLTAAPAAVGNALATLYAVYGRAGLRVGEGRALQGSDVDLARRTLLVERQIHRDGVEGDPKDSEPRIVDLSTSLHRLLEPLVRERRGWLFPFAIDVAAYRRIREGMAEVAQAANLHRLPPKSLRHSFASVLLARGESEAYVQEQLGHADPRTTRIYSRHFRVQRARSMDEL